MGNAGDRFACMIAHCGVFNLESMYLRRRSSGFVDWDLGGRLLEVARSRRRLPPLLAASLRTELEDAAARDPRRERLPRAVRPGPAGLHRGPDAGCAEPPARVPDEGHWILQPQNAVLWQREFFGWLDRFCKPQPSSKPQQPKTPSSEKK
jgi:hypothetical protein